MCNWDACDVPTSPFQTSALGKGSLCLASDGYRFVWKQNLLSITNLPLHFAYFLNFPEHFRITAPSSVNEIHPASDVQRITILRPVSPDTRPAADVMRLRASLQSLSQPRTSPEDFSAAFPAGNKRSCLRQTGMIRVARQARSQSPCSTMQGHAWNILPGRTDSARSPRNL